MFPQAAVAFSGGVDSSLLYHAAREALGPEKVFIFRAVSVLVSKREQHDAENLLHFFAPDPKKIVTIELAPLTWEDFIANGEERCYVCKRRMYTTFLDEVQKRGCRVLLDGTNRDDRETVRPGFKAIEELGVRTPLLDAGLGKQEIRLLACSVGLPSHNKPSNSCLATRIPHGTVISREKLAVIEKSESFLLDHGLTGCRVRIEGEDAVIQLTAEGRKYFFSQEFSEKVEWFMQNIGFKRLLLDVNPRC